MLSLYLAFLYANKPYYDPHRILCIAQYLLNVQSRNRLSQKGVLKRFSTKCYGKQNTLETIRAEKAFKFRELKHEKCSKEYEKYFLRYFPGQKNYCNEIKKDKKDKKDKTIKRDKKHKTIKRDKKHKTIKRDKKDKKKK